MSLPNAAHALPPEPDPAAQRASTTGLGELLGEVTRDISTLMRQEVELAKAEITDSEWQRAWQLGQDFLVKRPQQLRDGSTHRSGRAVG